MYNCSPAIWYECQSAFNRLPFAGLIAESVLCMHGGVSPALTHLNIIRSAPRPMEPIGGVLTDLLWAGKFFFETYSHHDINTLLDPTNKGDGWFYSARGISYSFGKVVLAEKLAQLGVDLVMRAHQVVQDGYEIMGGGQLVTIFSVCLNQRRVVSSN